MTPNPAIMRSVEQLGYRVTVGDVATQIGLNIAEVNQSLLALAADAGGHLQVAESGDVVYQFPQNFRDIIRNKYLQIRLQEWWKKVWSVLFYLIRISFGILLVTSIVLILVTITIIMTASSDRDNDNRSNNSRGFNFFFFPDLFWYFSPNHRDSYQERRRERGENNEMNFFEAVFSFLFGDGDPNANLEERRWEEIGASKKQRRSISEYLHEFSWKFSSASSGQLMLSAGLGGVNFVGALILGNLLKNGTIATQIGGLVAFVQGIYGLLLAYGIGFLAIPLIRYFWIKRRNDQVSTRNLQRQERARLLAGADDSLQKKIDFAREFATEKVIGKEDSVYSTEADLLEQEFQNKQIGNREQGTGNRE
jgi:hypothetical protein